MLQIEMEDFLAVLELVKPYLIALGILLILGLIIFFLTFKLKKNKGRFARAITLSSMLMSILVIANLISFGPLATLISLSMGNGTISDKTSEKAIKVAEEIAGEGFVMLKNDKASLPLNSNQKVNVFGWAGSNPLYGGAGSGGINNLYKIVSLTAGLEEAGLKVNQELVKFYNEYTSERPEMSIQKQSWTLPEPPASTYSDELMTNAKEYSDKAIIVISRMAGEGHVDMPQYVTKAAYDNNSKEYADFQEGEHYLQLSQTEKDMIQKVSENFDDITLIYNGANQFELGFVNEYEQIKSVIWTPGPGNNGFSALGKILTGEINPSGKTPDTFVYDMTVAPWWNNAQNRKYSNMEHLATEGMNAGRPTMFYPSFVNYVEGIYTGYKYYETAADEGIIDYDKTVQYPFGYGLSYTDFTQEMSEIKQNGEHLEFTVTVTNTGEAAGKDVVQVYANPPYTNGGIEKSTANLIEFSKTKELAPQESEVLNFSIPIEELSSYDYKGEKSYVLDEGQYILSINDDSHTELDSETWVLKEKIVYKDDNKRSSDAVQAVNAFDDVAGNVVYLSRKDKFANLSEATAVPKSTELASEYIEQYHTNANFDKTTYIDKNDKMPKVGVDNGLKLVDLRDANYDDERWEKLVQQMSVSEMSELIAMAGYQTSVVNSIGKVQSVDVDGPAALNNNFTKAGSVGFPVAVVIASTWNKELAKEYGDVMGEMAKEMNVSGWYAPGMNLHRTPFGARNYEYYSEDGVLSGKIASEAVKGAKSQGVYSFIKHFALYDGNAKMVNVWSNEQAIRENYLKAFEIPVKEGGANAVMASWNYLGIKWVGENSKLLNTVLRDEWGFRGMVLTDFFRNNGHGFMNADMALANGVDAMLSTYNGPENNVANPKAATSVLQMQKASKNILYTVVSNWQYEDGNDLNAIQNWEILFYIVDAVLVAGVGFLLFRSYKKYKQAI